MSLIVLVLGFQFAFYCIFSQFSLYDDEGALLLRVRQFVDNPSTYDQISGFYGPLYYLHKYVIYHLLDMEVSHAANRLTTIAFWLMIAWVGALLVFRMTGSVVLGLVALFQLIILLRQLVAEPGHPHELGLLLVFLAVLAASCIGAGRSRLVVFSCLGGCIGALLLVKFNLGLFLAFAVALASLYAFPPTRPVVLLRRFATLLAVMVPGALTARYLGQAYAINFLVLCASAIACCLLIPAGRVLKSPPAPRDVLACVMAALLVFTLTGLVIVGMGNTVGAVIDSVIFRPLIFSAPAHVSFAPMSSLIFYTAPVALAAVLCYRYLMARGQSAAPATMTVAVVKVSYAAYALFMLNFMERGVFGNPLLLPLVWILLIQPRHSEIVDFRNQFPRLLLCVLAAFLILQEFPVPGSQRIWTILLLIPVVMICLYDALPVIAKKATARFAIPSVTRYSQRYSFVASLTLCGVLAVGYSQKMNLAGLKAAFFSYTPLGLVGTGPMRLPRPFAQSLRALVDETQRHCDGWLGFPEFHSLYIWTGIAPPGAMTSVSILELEEQNQYRLIEQMDAYTRPCIVYSPENLKVRARNTPVDYSMPLARYIQTQFTPKKKFGWVELMMKKGTDTLKP